MYRAMRQGVAVAASVASGVAASAALAAGWLAAVGFVGGARHHYHMCRIEELRRDKEEPRRGLEDLRNVNSRHPRNPVP